MWQLAVMGNKPLFFFGDMEPDSEATAAVWGRAENRTPGGGSCDKEGPGTHGIEASDKRPRAVVG